MASMKSPFSSFVGGSSCAMGFFTWSVPENTLFADDVFAELYELAPAEVSAGIRVEDILEKIVDDDRPLLARKIHQAIISGRPSTQSYRVRRSDGTSKELVSFGRCMRDQRDVPSFYTGAVVDPSNPAVTVSSDTFAAHCTAAMNIALIRKNELAASYIRSALHVAAKGSQDK
ncbi:PAS domain-containing protein [Agrobacterium larrymoorei]|uniref:PAS domain-containing protein n=1 Tax=Agrobacterium larrymoorei TaxID=160699 RepID=A0ABX8T8D6_9HYPH|nr:PAS domain-containing protein [Agrobacterium larrymoorei]QYA08694.1 PAS domain-containing protein [Agrobacterium larrymoorei]